MSALLGWRLCKNPLVKEMPFGNLVDMDCIRYWKTLSVSNRLRTESLNSFIHVVRQHLLRHYHTHLSM